MLTPEQIVAAIKMDEAVKARDPRNSVDEPWATNSMHFAPRDHTGTPAPLPKPPQVEKWQQWICQSAIQPELRHGDTIVNVASVLPSDPAAEERRALEATAKRLIDNPPAWAYPKAWMMAVLRQVERRVPASRLEREFSPRFCFYEELRLYQERRSAGQTHDTAKAGLNVPELCDAYARGMDIRAKPLLTRPVGIGRVR